jgi:hypothetical protein
VTVVAQPKELEISGHMAIERAHQHVFFGISALIFAASAALTAVWSALMSSMGEMPMPGGWSMAMAWMRMPGQTWPGAAVSFLVMWVVMTVATAAITVERLELQPSLSH